MKEKDKCISFLKTNGWKYEKNEDFKTEYKTYYKDGYYSIDINNDEIVFIADVGDIANLTINYYALIGFLIEHKQIACNYKSI